MLSFHSPMSAPYLPTAAFNLDPSADVLLVGDSLLAREAQRRCSGAGVSVRSVGHWAEALQCLACHQFAAVVFTEESALNVRSAFDAYDASLGPDGNLRWCMLVPEAPVCTVQSDCAAVRAITIGTADWLDLLKHIRSIAGKRDSRLEELRLQILEEHEAQCGGHLAEALAHYRQAGTDLLKRIADEAQRPNVEGLRDASHALAAMAESMGDLTTAKGAAWIRDACHAGTIGRDAIRLDLLASQFHVAATALTLYFSAHTLVRGARAR